MNPVKNNVTMSPDASIPSIHGGLQADDDCRVGVDSAMDSVASGKAVAILMASGLVPAPLPDGFLVRLQGVERARRGARAMREVGFNCILITMAVACLTVIAMAPISDAADFVFFAVVILPSLTMGATVGALIVSAWTTRLRALAYVDHKAIRESGVDDASDALNNHLDELMRVQGGHLCAFQFSHLVQETQFISHKAARTLARRASQ